MEKKTRSVDAKSLWLGAAIGAGVAAWAIPSFHKHPERWPANIRRQVALDSALKQARQNGAHSIEKTVSLRDFFRSA